MNTLWRTQPVAWVEAFVVFNLAFLAVDIYVAHSMNHFGHAAEWVPFAFSIAAPIVLLPFFPRSIEDLERGRGRWVGIFVGACSIIVGIAGLILHLESQFFVRLTVQSLVYTAPFVAPLSYTGLGFLLLLNRMVTITRRDWCDWVLFLTAGGVFGNFILALADHAQNGFFHWTEWIPVYASAIMLGFLVVLVLRDPGHVFIRICAAVTVVHAGIGILGFGYHALANLHGPSSSIWDNTVYGAPIFAPMLLPNLSLLILIGLWRRWKLQPIDGNLSMYRADSTT